MDKVCPSCGRQLQAHPNRVYCSMACRQRAKRRRALGLPLLLPAAAGRGELARLSRSPA